MLPQGKCAYDLIFPSYRDVPIFQKLDLIGLCSLVSTYFMVDALRAIHMRSPPVLRPGGLSFPLNSGRDFKSLYETLLSASDMPIIDLSSAEQTLLLLALLSEIISFQYSFRSLLKSSNSRHRSSDVKGSRPESHQPSVDHVDHVEHEGLDIYQSTSASTASVPSYANPFMPFSAAVEYRSIKRKFNRALDKWSTACHASNYPSHRNVDQYMRVEKTLIPLIHFCYLVLEAGGDIWLLPPLAGYVPLPENASDPNVSVMPPTLGNTMVPKIGNAAVSAAWQVFETMGAGDSYTSSRVATSPSNSSITPVWYPYIIFYAALVVWSRFTHDSHTASTSSMIPARKRLLGTFQQELEQIKPQWGCTRRMIEVIKGLRSDI